MASSERRKENNARAILLPVALATLGGTGGGFAGVNAGLKVIETRVNYLERDLRKLTAYSERAAVNEMELAVRGQWIITTDRRLIFVEDKINQLEKEHK